MCCDTQARTMRLTSVHACPKADAWQPVHNMDVIMPSKPVPLLKSHPRMVCVPSGMLAEGCNTAYEHQTLGSYKEMSEVILPNGM